jgi:hypothetical protein
MQVWILNGNGEEIDTVLPIQLTSTKSKEKTGGFISLKNFQSDL